MARLSGAAAAVAVMVWATAATAGGCGVVAAQVHGVSGFRVASTRAFVVATPYALPVATPVSVYAAVGYAPTVAGYHAPAIQRQQPAAQAAGCGCAVCQCQAAPQQGPSAMAEEAPEAVEPVGLRILRTKCAGCHAPGGKGYDTLALFAEGGGWADGWKSSNTAIVRAIVNQSMPPADKPRLTAEERLAILGAFFHETEE